MFIFKLKLIIIVVMKYNIIILIVIKTNRFIVYFLNKADSSVITTTVKAIFFHSYSVVTSFTRERKVLTHNDLWLQKLTWSTVWRSGEGGHLIKKQGNQLIP